MTRLAKLHQGVSTLPLTNAFGILAILMWGASCVVSLANLPVTDGWYTALTFYTGAVVAQWGIKRKTTWKPGGNGDVAPSGAAGEGSP